MIRLYLKRIREYGHNKRADSQNFHHRYFYFSVSSTEHTELDILARYGVSCPRSVLMGEGSVRNIVTKELTQTAPLIPDLVNKQLILWH